MRLNRNQLFLSTLLSASAFSAHATLTSYHPNGVPLVYSSFSDITWTQDGNLLGTLEDSMGFENAINAIIAASATINDTPNDYDGNDGTYNVTASDFNDLYHGKANWFGATAFVNYLNSIGYGGSNHWRLPSAGDNPESGYYPAGSEFGQLFHSELGGQAFFPTPDTKPFFGVLHDGHWLGTESSTLNYGTAWYFYFGFGTQNESPKYSSLNVWAVTPGRVATVPSPSVIWLFGSSLLGVISVNRRRKR